MLHFVASEEHFIDHLAPIWHATDQHGEFWVLPDMVTYAQSLVPTATAAPAYLKAQRGDFIGVASEIDRKRAIGHSLIRFEHGCGLSYAGDVSVPLGAPRRAVEAIKTHQSYPGGRGHLNVKAFLQPNRYAADRWRQAYPNAAVEVIGTPKLDRWHNAPPKPRSAKPVVAVSFHVDINVAPETQSAFMWFKAVLPTVAKRSDIQLVAHCHPRARASIVPFYQEHGITFVQTFAEVMERADVYAVDNSSTLFEFASLDRPVVVINAPVYRRDVHHGLRFWEHADVGVQCDSPADLNKSIDKALIDPPEVAAARQSANDDCYPYRGHAGERAAEVISSIVGSLVNA